MTRIALDETASAGRARPFDDVNWLGLWTLYLKEVERFWKVLQQTMIAPVITALLFLLIFDLAFGGTGRGIAGVPFLVFLAPGLIMMSIIQNAFANTSSSIMVAKVQGNIVDILMPPLSPGELTLGYAMGGVTRGIVVGIAVGVVIWLVMQFDVALTIHDPLAIAYFAIAAGVMLSLIGIMVAVWSEKFDNQAAIQNFVITPLVFLSGTFYSVDRLSGVFAAASRVNPFFYLIDGFRYGFIGESDSSVIFGAAIVAAIDAALWLCCYLMFARGYKLKT